MPAWAANLLLPPNEFRNFVLFSLFRKALVTSQSVHLQKLWDGMEYSKFIASPPVVLAHDSMSQQKLISKGGWCFYGSPAIDVMNQPSLCETTASCYQRISRFFVEMNEKSFFNKLCFLLLADGFQNFQTSFPEWCEDERTNNMQSNSTEQLMGLR